MAVPERQFDILPRRHCRDEIEALEHKADLLPPQIGPFLLGQRVYRRIVEIVFSRGRRVEQSEDVAERAFATHRDG